MDQEQLYYRQRFGRIYGMLSIKTTANLLSPKNQFFRTPYIMACDV